MSGARNASPTHTNVLNQNFLPILKRAGLPRIRFHDLRHTATTFTATRTSPAPSAADTILSGQTHASSTHTIATASPALMRSQLARAQRSLNEVAHERNWLFADERAVT